MSLKEVTSDTLKGVKGFSRKHILIAVIALFLGACVYALFIKTDGRHFSAQAHGSADWLYQDTHTEDHGLSVEEFGTPQRPKGLDVVPLANRNVSEDGTRFTSLKDGQVFSLDRTMVEGSIRLSATDLTPVDQTVSWDSADMEATFVGPDGAQFRIVLTRLTPPDLYIQTFGGVAFNHYIHGETGVGTTALFPEYAYGIINGFSDVYRNDELIAEDRYTYVAVSQRARTLNTDKNTDHYDLDEPLGKLLIHLVVLPKTQSKENGGYAPIPTGIIGPDGKEQEFFHVNFSENIEVFGNRFFNARTEHGLQ